MNKMDEIFNRYFPVGTLNQDHFKSISVQVFAGAVCKIPNHEIGFKAVDPEMMRAYLDVDDFETWMKLREEWLSNNES